MGGLYESEKRRRSRRMPALSQERIPAHLFMRSRRKHSRGIHELLQRLFETCHSSCEFRSAEEKRGCRIGPVPCNT